MHYGVVHVIRDLFKFRLFVHRTVTWGYLLNDSVSFDGMIGMLERREIDFGCSPAFFRVERLIAVDYGAQTGTVKPKFIFRHPNAKGMGQNVFLEPFENAVWIVLVVSSVVITVALAKITSQESALFGGPNTKRIAAHGKVGCEG